MNTIPALSRACASHNIPFRSIPSRSRILQYQRRTLTTTTTPQAQPIELVSSKDPTSPSESSIFASDTLSRASSGSNLDSQAPSSSSTTTSENPQPPPSSSSSSSPNTTIPTKTTTQPSLSTTSPFLLLGTVSRTGTMTTTVQITTRKQVFDKFLQKHYTRPFRLLAHDPNPAGFLREGDVVEYGLFSPVEKAAKEEKRLEFEGHLLEKGVIRLKTRKGKERKLADVGVKRRGPRWIVRKVISPFGEGEVQRLERLRVVEVEREKEMQKEREAGLVGKSGRVGKRRQSRGVNIAN